MPKPWLFIIYPRTTASPHQVQLKYLQTNLLQGGENEAKTNKAKTNKATKHNTNRKNIVVFCAFVEFFPSASKKSSLPLLSSQGKL